MGLARAGPGWWEGRNGGAQTPWVGTMATQEAKPLAELWVDSWVASEQEVSPDSSLALNWEVNMTSPPAF